MQLKSSISFLYATLHDESTMQMFMCTNNPDMFQSHICFTFTGLKQTFNFILELNALKYSLKLQVY